MAMTNNEKLGCAFMVSVALVVIAVLLTLGWGFVQTIQWLTSK